MKIRTISLMCVSLVLLFAVTANAQLKAGSDEDKAFRKISAEKNTEAQIPLLLEFANSFPQSKALPDVYLMLVGIYNDKKDTTKVAEYGEKAVKADPQNIEALVQVSRVYAMERKNLDVAVSYAQKAVDNV